MKKISQHILILVVLMGFSGPAMITQATGEKCWFYSGPTNGWIDTGVNPNCGTGSDANNLYVWSATKPTNSPSQTPPVPSTPTTPTAAPSPTAPTVTLATLGSCTIRGDIFQKVLEKDCKNGVWKVYSTTNLEPTLAPLESSPLIKSCTATDKDGKCLNPNVYVLLAPLPCKIGTLGCDTSGQITTFDPTQTNNLGAYLNMMIRLFIGICGVLAVIMIVLGGVEYMTSELISSKEAGKERITNALFGLLLALGSWTLLNTINPDILKSDLKSLAPVTVEVVSNDNVPQSYDPVTKKYPGGYTYGNKWDDTVRKIVVLPTGVRVNNSQCATLGQTNCTSTRGLKLDYINTIQTNCPNKCGDLNITGGTESWLHGGKTGYTTHMLDSPTVDLQVTTELSNYIKSGKSLGNNMYLKDNIQYIYEAYVINGTTVTHWHVGK